jgi:hypothetical protein
MFSAINAIINKKESFLTFSPVEMKEKDRSSYQDPDLPTHVVMDPKMMDPAVIDAAVAKTLAEERVEVKETFDDYRRDYRDGRDYRDHRDGRYGNDSSSGSHVLMTAVILIIEILIGVWAAKLSWSSNELVQYSVVPRAIFAIFAFLFGVVYLLSYLLFKWDLVTEIVRISSGEGGGRVSQVAKTSEANARYPQPAPMSGGGQRFPNPEYRGEVGVSIPPLRPSSTYPSSFRPPSSSGLPRFPVPRSTSRLTGSSNNLEKIFGPPRSSRSSRSIGSIGSIGSRRA